MQIVKETPGSKQLVKFDDYNPAFHDIQLISFDIWNTLLTRNILFSRYRNLLLAKEFLPTTRHNAQGVEFLHVAVKTANLLVDAIQETQGRQIGPQERLHVIVDQLNVLLALDHNDIDYQPIVSLDFDMDEIVDEINALFLNNLPNFINPDVVRTIKFYQGILPVAFVSNTGLIGGKVMREALPMLGLEPDYMIFSDEVGVAKPKAAMFEPLKQLPCVTDAKNILHIGDNLIADIKGATDAGLSALYFNPAEKLVEKQDGEEILVPAFRKGDGPVTIASLNDLEAILRCNSTCYANKFLPPLL